MSQRVYLIPIKPDLVKLYNELIVTDSAEREVQLWEAIRRRAERHQRVTRTSCRLASALSVDKFTAAGRESDYYAYSAMRPYLLTDETPEQVVQSMRGLLRCADTREVETLLKEQMRSLAPFREDPGEGGEAVDEESDWDALKRNVDSLRYYRRCYTEQTSIDIEVLRRTSGDEAVEMWDIDETEVKTIPPSKIPEVYGGLIGTTLGRIAGQSEPTWWLGNNIWLGLCAFGRMYADFFTRLRLSKLQKRIRQHATTPATLFTPSAMPGFQHGFDLSCPGYSTGLYFPLAAIAALQQSMQNEQQTTDWQRLASAVTGYSPQDVLWSLRMVKEAFVWAASERCGLLEGDELVGMWGMR